MYWEIEIRIDTREPDEIFNLFVQFQKKHFKLKSDCLEFGDVAFKNEVGIERKTYSDFISSIMDGRFREQLYGLKKTYRYPYVVVVGSSSVSGMKREAIIGAYASCLGRYKVPLCFVRNNAEFVLLSYGIIEKHFRCVFLGEGLKLEVKKEKTVYSPDDVFVLLLSSIPGIGYSKALKISNSVKSFPELYEKLRTGIKIDGIGEKTRKLLLSYKDLFVFGNKVKRTICKYCSSLILYSEKEPVYCPYCGSYLKEVDIGGDVFL